MWRIILCIIMLSIKLTEIFDSLSRNKKKFKIKCIISLYYLRVLDDVDLVENNTACTCKTLDLFWPTGNVVATFR